MACQCWDLMHWYGKDFPLYVSQDYYSYKVFKMYCKKRKAKYFSIRAYTVLVLVD